MNSTIIVLVLPGLFLASVFSCCAGELESARAVAQLERLGAEVTVDDKSPGRPVIGAANINGAGVPYLRALRNLESLELVRSNVTDAKLEDITGLDKLKSLALINTSVTDAGLTHLEGLSRLQTLYLGRAQSARSIRAIRRPQPRRGPATRRYHRRRAGASQTVT